MNRGDRHLWIELAAVGLVLGSLFMFIAWLSGFVLIRIDERISEVPSMPRGTGVALLGWLGYSAALSGVAWALRSLLRED